MANNKALAVRNGSSVTPRTKRTDRACARARAKNARWQSAFLRALRQTPNVQAACKSCGRSRSYVYECRNANETFARAWDDALGASIDKLESKAFELATRGDSTLITFMLRCHKPQVYRERSEVAVAAASIIYLPQKSKGAE